MTSQCHQVCIIQCIDCHPSRLIEPYIANHNRRQSCSINNFNLCSGTKRKQHYTIVNHNSGNKEATFQHYHDMPDCINDSYNCKMCMCGTVKCRPTLAYRVHFDALIAATELITRYYSNENLAQCCFNVSPTSATLADI